jgi:trimeric autotransporter adhesin
MAVTLNANTSTGFIATSDTSGVLQLQTGGTAAVTVDASQNVGVGTSTLNDKFNLYSTTSAYQRFQNSTTGTGATDGFQIGNDANAAYVWNYENTQTIFATNNAERMRIDSSGNVGIGTSSPNRKLVVSNAGAQGFEFGAGTGSGSSNEVLNYNRSTSLYVPSLLYASTHTFFVGTAGGTRAVDIDSNGVLLVGTQESSVAAGAGVKIFPSGSNSVGISIVNAATTNSDLAYRLYSTGAAAYRFYVGYAGTVFATNTTISAISDQRLKENVQDLDVGLDAVMALKPRKFDWKEGKGKDIKGDRGWIAQEFEQVFPDMIDEWLDPSPEGEDPYKSVRADLIPVLVKAIQEQQAIIQTLTDRITALEGTTP